MQDYSRQSVPYGPQGTDQGISAVKNLIRESSGVPEIHDLAADAVSHIDPKNHEGRLRSLFSYAQNRFRFVRDPHHIEFVKSSNAILRDLNQYGHVRGDCDDAVVFLGSLTQSAGYPTRVSMIKADSSRPDDYSHIYLEAHTGQKWVPMDIISKDNRFGWEYKNHLGKRSDNVTGTSGLGQLHYGTAQPHVSLLAGWNLLSLPYMPVRIRTRTRAPARSRAFTHRTRGSGRAGYYDWLQATKRQGYSPYGQTRLVMMRRAPFSRVGSRMRYGFGMHGPPDRTVMGCGPKTGTNACLIGLGLPLTQNGKYVQDVISIEGTPLTLEEQEYVRDIAARLGADTTPEETVEYQRLLQRVEGIKIPSHEHEYPGQEMGPGIKPPPEYPKTPPHGYNIVVQVEPGTNIQWPAGSAIVGSSAPGMFQLRVTDPDMLGTIRALPGVLSASQGYLDPAGAQGSPSQRPVTPMVRPVRKKMWPKAMWVGAAGIALWIVMR